MPASLPTVDALCGTDRPWLAPWREALAVLGPLDHAARMAWLNQRACAHGLRNAAGHPIMFAAPDDAGAAAYEAHIFATGRVPTRAATTDSAHDLFNALVWLRFPRAKAALNARQASVLARDGVRGRRGRERDAATLIDENALLLVCADAGHAADLRRHLDDHAWPALFMTARARWQRDIAPVVFGHALLDKLQRPYKAITAHAIVLVVGADEDIDAALAQYCASTLDPAALRPLPVLGVPGWWPANEHAAFYNDAAVFRPARRAA